MKTAISVEDSLMQQVDQAAAKDGISRSKFFCLAAAEVLKRRQDEEITEALNRSYADGPTDEERRIVAGMKAKFRTIVKDKW